MPKPNLSKDLVDMIGLPRGVIWFTLECSLLRMPIIECEHYIYESPYDENFVVAGNEFVIQRERYEVQSEKLGDIQKYLVNFLDLPAYTTWFKLKVEYGCWPAVKFQATLEALTDANDCAVISGRGKELLSSIKLVPLND